MIEVKSTLREQPIRLVIYGKGGVGKSTFCAKFPDHVFIPIEDGLSNIQAEATRQPTSWSDFLQLVRALASDTRFKAIVIDSLDAAEMLCWEHVAKLWKKPDISSIGYKDGYATALNEFRILLNELDAAHKNGKAILLIAHATRRTVQNPTGDNYQAYGMKLYDGPAASVVALIREWVDVVAFAEEDIAVDGDKRKGFSTGKRFLRLQPKAGYDAKTRFAMPPSIELEWPLFEQELRNASFTRVPELKKELDGLVSQIPELGSKVDQFVTSRGASITTYRQAIETMRERIKQRDSGTNAQPG